MLKQCNYCRNLLFYFVVALFITHHNYVASDYNLRKLKKQEASTNNTLIR